jgi:hypothetical protein
LLRKWRSDGDALIFGACGHFVNSECQRKNQQKDIQGRAREKIDIETALETKAKIPQ